MSNSKDSVDAGGVGADVPLMVSEEDAHQSAHLGAETGAPSGAEGGDARARSRGKKTGAEEDGVTPDRFRAAFRTEKAPEAGPADEAAAAGGKTHAGGARHDSWGHESEGAMDVLGHALAFVWSGWYRVVERNALALKREGRLRELGVRVATLSDDGRLGAVDGDPGVRAVLRQLEQIAEAEAELEADSR